MEKEEQKKRFKTWVIAIVVAVLLGLALWGIFSSHILHREAKSISPDGSMKYEIYNRSFEKASHSKEEKIITVNHYYLPKDASEWKLLSKAELEGNFVGCYWSGDSRHFVIEVQDTNENIYLFDNKENYMRRLDPFFDMQLINVASFDSRLYHYLLSANQQIDYEFVQWAKNSDLMLIRYVIDRPEFTERSEMSGTELTGYFWYDCTDNVVKGLVETSK